MSIPTMIRGQVAIVQEGASVWSVTEEIKISLSDRVYSNRIGSYRSLVTAKRMAKGRAAERGFQVRYWEGGDDSNTGVLL